MRKWILLVVTLTGCFDGKARQIFSQDNYCPPGRIKITHRREIIPSNPNYRPPPVAPVPPEIQSDPERLRMWEKGHPTVPPESKAPQTEPIIEAQGCGVTTWYSCYTEVTNENGPRRTERDVCEAVRTTRAKQP